MNQPFTPKPISLRPYQMEGVRGISAEYQRGAQGLIYRCPTGGGKTRTASYIVNKYVTSGRQVLWLVDQEELLDQAAMTFAEYGIEHTLVCADKTARAIKAHQFLEFGRSFVASGAMAIIASVQTLVRRVTEETWTPDVVMGWLNPAQIVADEADLSLAATWRKVIGFWPEARLLGLTATPTRLDRQSFAREDGGLYDGMIFGPTESWLMDNGYLAQYDAYRPDVALVQGVANLNKTKGDDYDPAELAKELDAPKVYGDVVQHYRDYSHGLPAIAFCPTVESAEKFAAAFRAAGFRSLSLDGETDGAVRRNAVKALGNGDMDVLTGVGLLVKGVDIPYATTAIWLRRTKSRRIFMQGCGRVFRPHERKERAILLDCVGVIEEHGLPHWEHEWDLKPAEKKARSAGTGGDGPEVVAMACPKCKKYHAPAPVCPNSLCGYVYPIKARRDMEQVDANLMKIDKEEEERLKAHRRMMKGQAKTVDQLMATGVGRINAMKIVAAREKKSGLIDAVLDGVALASEENGATVSEMFGVTMAGIRKMRPAELKALLERVTRPVKIERLI